VIDKDAEWRRMAASPNRHELELDKIKQALRLPQWSHVAEGVFQSDLFLCLGVIDLLGKARGC
jgi:hypothetical protein